MDKIWIKVQSVDKAPLRNHYGFYRTRRDDELALVVSNLAKEAIYPFVWN